MESYHMEYSFNELLTSPGSAQPRAPVSSARARPARCDTKSWSRQPWQGTGGDLLFTIVVAKRRSLFEKGLKQFEKG